MEYATANECDQVDIHYSENLVAFQLNIKDIKILATSLLIQ
jgi:hypothetical protein